LKPNLRKYFNNKSDSSEIFISFSIFKRELRQVFEIFNEKKIAKRVIQHLQQKILAADYVARFQKYANLANWDSIALITIFKRDLKNNVKNKLMRTGAKIDSIQVLIEMAISVDNRLYKRNIKKRYDQFHERAEISFESTIENYAKKDYFKKYSNPDYCGPASMELNSIQQHKEKNPKEKQDNKNSKTCYLCGKSSHFAQDCCSKNLIIPQQINAILREILDS